VVLGIASRGAGSGSFDCSSCPCHGIKLVYFATCSTQPSGSYNVYAEWGIMVIGRIVQKCCRLSDLPVCGGLICKTFSGDLWMGERGFLSSMNSSHGAQGPHSVASVSKPAPAKLNVPISKTADLPRRFRNQSYRHGPIAGKEPQRHRGRINSIKILRLELPLSSLPFRNS
jgi:hypothetical protein